MSTNERKGYSGRIVTVTAPTGGLTSGDLYAFRSGTTGWVGEVRDDIAATEDGPVEVGHQASVSKKTGTGESFSQGDLVYWDSSDGNVTPNSTGNDFVGSAAEDAGTSASEVMVVFALTGGDS